MHGGVAVAMPVFAVPAAFPAGSADLPGSMQRGKKNLPASPPAGWE